MSPKLFDDEPIPTKPAASKKSKAKQKFRPLEPPVEDPTNETPDRNGWIEKVCAEFVCPTSANRAYYRVILEMLFPEGHGIPGPYVTQRQLRDAIDDYRRSKHKGNTPYRNYADPFRRVRELQGEEGFTGIAIEGHTYQLVSLETSEKRIPRTHLSDESWQAILKEYDYKCASCGRGEPEVRLQQDHKVPRVRADKVALLQGGVDNLPNWQPLCDECNIFKSTSCRACTLDCFICPWAYPEKFSPLILSLENAANFRAFAEKKGVHPNKLFNHVIKEYLEMSG